MLTLETLKSFPPGEIFQTGTFIDSKEPGEGNVALCLPISNKKVRWVAVKGRLDKLCDWCIYAENPHYQGTDYEFIAFEDIKRRGDKIMGEANIKKLIPCSDEVFERYRY